MVGLNAQLVEYIAISVGVCTKFRSDQKQDESCQSSRWSGGAAFLPVSLLAAQKGARK